VEEEEEEEEVRAALGARRVLPLAGAHQQN
jgi:hypothetical protein